MYVEEDLPSPAEGSRRSDRRCRKQLDGCADAGGGGLKRLSVEIWGGAEWGGGVVCADRWTAGHGEGEGRRQCPWPHAGASRHGQRCVYTKLSPWQ